LFLLNNLAIKRMIKTVKSFLANNRLPHFGHDESRVMYSVNFDRFQL